MAFATAERCGEYTITTGTGTITTAGAPQQMQTFSSGIGTGNTCLYMLLSGNGIDWEQGLGTVTVSAGVTTVARTTVIASTNSGSAISLVGSSFMFTTDPAKQVGQNGLWDQMLGATRGMIPYRLTAASGWSTLTLGAANTILQSDGTDAAWTKKAYVIAFSHPSTAVFTASEVCGHHRAAKAITFPANFGTFSGLASQAGGSAVTTASTVFNLQLAATATPNTFSTIGTVTFALGTVTPTFATSGGTTQAVAQGDVLRIIAPASADATFAGGYFTFVAQET